MIENQFKLLVACIHVGKGDEQGVADQEDCCVNQREWNENALDQRVVQASKLFLFTVAPKDWQKREDEEVERWTGGNQNSVKLLVFICWNNFNNTIVIKTKFFLRQSYVSFGQDGNNEVYQEHQVQNDYNYVEKFSNVLSHTKVFVNA